MPLTDRERKLLGIESISFEVPDKALPKKKDPPPVETSNTGQRVPAGPPLLKVEDVLGPTSPYRKIDSGTGEEIIDTTELHISQMDREDLKKELLLRVKKGKEVIEELTILQSNIDKAVEADGNFSIKVDISKINIRQAIMRVFGKRTDIITYPMYKQLLAIKEQMNKEDVTGMAGGFKLGDNLCADKE